jgi:peptidoglycan/LPS O-acetylase OafA/YrhL
MEKNGFYGVRFDSIQLLRGIAALIVITEHIVFLQCGAFGVDIFFVISGFIIMYTTQETMKSFWIKRLIRIVPLYWGMTFSVYAALLVAPGIFELTVANPVNLLKSLCFIPFAQAGIVQPLVRIGWSVNYEMFFYLVFGVAARISHKYRGLIVSMVYLGLVFGCGYIPYKPAAFAFYCDPMQLEFVLGIVCFYVVRRIYQCDIPKRLSYLSLVLGLAGLAVLMVTRKTVSLEVLGRFLHWGIPSALIFLLFVTAGRRIRIPAAFVRLGDMSFSIYLIHYYVLRVAEKVFCDMSVLSAKTVLAAVVSIVLIIGASYISWYVVEKKFTGWLRRWILVSRRVSR